MHSAELGMDIHEDTLSTPYGANFVHT